MSQASNAADLNAYGPIARWTPQDASETEVTEQGASVEIDRLLKDRQLAELFSALKLSILLARDADAPAIVQNVFQFLLPRYPHASLWSVCQTPALTWRVAALRTFFATHEAARVVERDEGWLDPTADVIRSECERTRPPHWCWS